MTVATTSPAVDQGPDRLEVGRVFADRLHELARAHDPRARHLSTLPTLGPVGWGDLPVVVSLDVPADLAVLYRDGELVAAYSLETLDTRHAHRAP